MTRRGETFILKALPRIVGGYMVGGEKEGKGPLGSVFDEIYRDHRFGKDTWEQGEIEMTSLAINGVLRSHGLDKEDINLFMGGDLLNQIVVANFVARSYDRPFIGLYGACSTMGEALGIAGMFIEAAFMERVLVFVSSHYQTAERQYRTPLEYGDQYPAWKQWTATAAGAFIIGQTEGEVGLSSVTFGSVSDWHIRDANDLGAAMAPAAARTIHTHHSDLQLTDGYYDAIFTGDLGREGIKLTGELLAREGYLDRQTLFDCGAMLFDREQQTGSGGSGCSCAAAVLSGYILPRLKSGEYKKVLLVPTGALLSPTTTLQGETIPVIAHALSLARIGEN